MLAIDFPEFSRPHDRFLNAGRVALSGSIPRPPREKTEGLTWDHPLAVIVYVLHAFQKKSKKGIATPQHEIELIKNRLELAEADYKRGESS